MTLQLWNELHKDMSMADKEKNKTVKFVVNLGTNDMRTYECPEAYQEGDTPDLPEHAADRLIRAGIAVEYTAEVKKADEEAQQKAHEAEVAAAMPIAVKEAALQAAKDEAIQRIKSGKTSAHRTARPQEPPLEVRNPTTDTPIQKKP